MGTRGANGMQKLFGSNALKIVSNSAAPFIVTQSKTSIENINKIAMTIDLARESIQVVKYATSIAKDFNSEIVLIAGDHTD